MRKRKSLSLPAAMLHRLGVAQRPAFAAGILLLAACATAPQRTGPRPFGYGKDSLAYANELVWEYGYDAAGQWQSHRRTPSPDYALHCFVVARDARQFFYHARFAPNLPRVTTAAYIDLVRKVLGRDPRSPSASTDLIVIPGYRDLHEFSRYWEYLLKTEGGGAWQSYLQRGNWRMVFPFSRNGQARTADHLVTELQHWRTPIVHVVTFPERTIDHAVLVYRATPTAKGVQFRIYDPNDAEHERVLQFDRESNTFGFPRTNYFAGGPVDVYEVYRSLFF